MNYDELCKLALDSLDSSKINSIQVKLQGMTFDDLESLLEQCSEAMFDNTGDEKLYGALTTIKTLTHITMINRVVKK